MSLELALTDIIVLFCTLLTFSLGLFALIKSSKKKVGLIFFLLSFWADVFYVSHLIGINAPNAHVAYMAFMFNLVNILIVASNYHFVYELFGQKTKGRKLALVSIYVVGMALLVFYLVYPQTFLLTPVPKMYMPFYYVPGSLYLVMRIYFLIVVAYILIDLARIYRVADVIEKNRIKYILIGFAVGYSLGSTAVFLVYNVQIDPLYSMLFGLYTLPFFYAFITYDLLDFHILARRALQYSIYAVLIGMLLVCVNAANDYFVLSLPGFPFWLLPFVSACVVVLIGGFVWNKISEVDKLKYEFVTVVTHKFRTPLTYIKWSAETLEKTTDPAEQKHAIQLIGTGVSRLAELTDLLIGLENADDTRYAYRSKPEDAGVITKEIAEGEVARAKEKSITFIIDVPPVPTIIKMDRKRFEFALQILIENAVSYTPRQGTVTISVRADQGDCVIAVKDSGIGISKEDMPFVFNRFFRGKEARLTDTEGMGIGLYMARQIIRKEGGSIEAASEGQGKGSTFMIRLLMANA